jgi:hypothetical protein
MDDKIGLRMDEVPCLFTDRFDNLGMTVTRIGHADATGEVEQFAPVIGVDVRAFGAISNKVEDAR